MKKLNTIFDYNQDTPEPQISALYDTDTKEMEFFPLYHKASKNTIKDVRTSLNKIFDMIKAGNVMINDTLSHMMIFKKFGLIPSTDHNIFDTRQREEIDNFESEVQIKKVLVKGIINMPKEADKWMSIKAKSSAVYAELNQRGVMYGSYVEHPVYDTGTLTGRSRTKSFNIQGSTKEDPIRHIDEDRTAYLCFDWVSADMRVAGFLSNDEFINNSFLESNPYTELEKLINLSDVTRDDCKLEILKSIYSVNFDSPLFDVMSNLKGWMIDKKSEYDDGNTLKTLLNMPIPRQNIKSSFSGIIQGTIAEAIQSILIKVNKQVGSECILTEIHDSLIVCCADGDIKSLIAKIVPLMLRPLDDIDLIFPVEVSIGKKWKKWKKYRTYR